MKYSELLRRYPDLIFTLSHLGHIYFTSAFTSEASMSGSFSFRAALRELPNERRGFRYRRLFVLLGRVGGAVRDQPEPPALGTKGSLSVSVGPAARR